MRFGSAGASLGKLEPGLRTVMERAEAELEQAQPDLACVFFSSHFEDEVQVLLDHLAKRYPSAMLAGCSAEGIIGADEEHERVPSVGILVGHLPGVQRTSFHIPAAQLENLDENTDWCDLVGVDPAVHPTFLFFGDPFSVPVNAVLEQFNRAYPGRPVLGGMASGCEAPRQSALIMGDSVHREGCGGVALWGPLQVEAVVSQGCRPIGHPLVITKCERNVIQQLGGRPALERLREIVRELPPADVQLARQAVFIGRVINEYKESFTRGDFLIRHLMGYDPQSGAIAVGEEVRVGATIQFHVRDAESADEDLRQMLAPHRQEEAPAGVLLFSCNGRGTRMWREPHHDVSAVRDVCGAVPVAGFFAAGEIGPVAGKNFIHGHTASMALFKKSIDPQTL